MNWNACSRTLTLPDGSTTAAVPTLECMFRIIASLVMYLMLFAGTVALALIIYSGIRLITSGGDRKSVEHAKKILTYSIAGLVLIFLSFLILNFISYVTGVSCIGPTILRSFSSCGGRGAGGEF